ncbi:helix-turn-helix domain-containing protein [Lihuaxuella thermophila]|uniref:Anaphase-promoting complex subunit 5 n=1 Tax=Lihuaxuella thermophila TaxID=1173111 RepID=A0A1H8DL61_9BACL|nr:tetratricopeptide repeat protein [Lihuaxuella thermophila]SEN07514.1 Anaphase-promoting complex subunit 5 [Lihuaxuella thermophila]
MIPLKYANLAQIGELLRKKRKELGLRLEDLADEQISPSTISNIERGMPHVNSEKVNYLSNKLGINLDELPELLDEEKQKLREIKLKLTYIENVIDLVSNEKCFANLKRLNLPHNHLYASTVQYLKGKYYMNKQKWNKAQNHFLEAIRLEDQSPELNKSNIKAASLNELARAYYFENRLEEALEYTEDGIKCFVENGERKYVKYILLVSKAVYLEKLDRIDEAQSTLQMLWEEREEIASLEVILNMYELKAAILKKLKSFDEAIRAAKEGIDIARINKVHNRSVELLITLGGIYMETGDLEAAEKSFVAALCIKEKLDKEYLLIPAYTQIGMVYLEQNKLEEALEHIKEAVKIGEKANDALRYSPALIALGDYHQKNGDPKEAIRYYQKALDLARKHMQGHQERELWFKLAQCWNQIDKNEFHRCMERLFMIEVQLNKPKREQIFIERR